jgi:hypothetical protein
MNSDLALDLGQFAPDKELENGHRQSSVTSMKGKRIDA